MVPTGYGNYYAIKGANDLKLFDLEDLKHMMKNETIINETIIKFISSAINTCNMI